MHRYPHNAADPDTCCCDACDPPGRSYAPTEADILAAWEAAEPDLPTREASE
jgi:hypothetical protein